jgi:hypothetical protein
MFMKPWNELISSSESSKVDFINENPKNKVTVKNLTNFGSKEI